MLLADYMHSINSDPGPTPQPQQTLNQNQTITIEQIIELAEKEKYLPQDEKQLLKGTLQLSLLDMFRLDIHRNLRLDNISIYSALAEIDKDGNISNFPSTINKVTEPAEETKAAIQKLTDSLSEVTELSFDYLYTMQNFVSIQQHRSNNPAENPSDQLFSKAGKVMATFNSTLKEDEQLKTHLAQHVGFMERLENDLRSSKSQDHLKTLTNLVFTTLFANCQSTIASENSDLNSKLNALKNNSFSFFETTLNNLKRHSSQEVALQNPWQTFQILMNSSTPLEDKLTFEVTHADAYKVRAYIELFISSLDGSVFIQSNYVNTYAFLRDLKNYHLSGVLEAQNRNSQIYNRYSRRNKTENYNLELGVEAHTIHFMYLQKLVNFLDYQLSKLLTDSPTTKHSSLTPTQALAEWIVLHPDKYSYHKTKTFIINEINKLNNTNLSPNDQHTVYKEFLGTINGAYLAVIISQLLKIQKLHLAKKTPPQTIQEQYPFLNEEPLKSKESNITSIYSYTGLTPFLAIQNQNSKQPFKNDTTEFQLLLKNSSSRWGTIPFPHFYVTNTSSQAQALLQIIVTVEDQLRREVQVANRNQRNPNRETALTIGMLWNRTSTGLAFGLPHAFMKQYILLIASNLVENYDYFNKRTTAHNYLSETMQKRYNIHPKVVQSLNNPNIAALITELETESTTTTTTTTTTPTMQFRLSKNFVAANVSVHTSFHNLHEGIAHKFHNNPKLQAILQAKFPHTIGLLTLTDNMAFSTPFFTGYNQYCLPVVLFPKTRKTRENLISFLAHRNIRKNNYLVELPYLLQVVSGIHLQKNQNEFINLFEVSTPVAMRDLKPLPNRGKLSKLVNNEVNIVSYFNDEDKSLITNLENQDDVFVEFMMNI